MLLTKTLEKLAAAQTSAREWKQVADNRLLLLTVVDSTLNAQIYQLLKVGTIFGVSPEDPGMPTADLRVHSADDITSFILHKIGAASSFTAHLADEAASLQLTLSSTLSIALEAQSVERPVLDLKVKDYTQIVGDATTPLVEIFSKLENDPPDRDHGTTTEPIGGNSDVYQRPDSPVADQHDDGSETSPEMQTALSIFKKNRKF